ncbi:hypothetical protein EVAR_44370_1 [Eumeta japonica]|uniref:Uncharacterized protein n=1 Tax=Eumeta variegata TaxID=151549 RepID=A0A4C1X7V4_EUMVA|nr:hypothetical protein EVAR_44370_1 [Eumeta japonica]
MEVNEKAGQALFIAGSTKFNEFKGGRVTSADEERSGSPLTVITEVNVLAAKYLIPKNKKITYKANQRIWYMGSGSHDGVERGHLRVMRIDSCEVPHNLTQAQKKERGGEGGRVGKHLRSISLAANSERQSFVGCTVQAEF